ncbi:MAG: hypothetical protein NTY36_01385 [Deltaproteobacteria bacterium]|nr:hypothetical protein [Deltaproteobacteria bacterium]
MLTDNEVEILKHIKRRGYIPSLTLKEIFNTPKGKMALTKHNFPNIRHKLRSFMTAESQGMYRGGFQWFSAVEWKDGYNSLDEFLKRELSI